MRQIKQRTKLKLTFALVCSATCLMARAQSDKQPLRVPEVVSSPAEFVPSGWRMEKEALKEVDLNGDGKPDAVLVISIDTHDKDTPDVNFIKHVLVLALRGDDGKLHRSVVSDAAV